MANPQIENGHVDIANEIMEALANIRISGEEWQILCVIFRKTYGWHKKEDAISLSQFYQATGIKKPSIIRAMRKLLAKKLINVSNNANKNPNSYSFNKDYHKWVSVSKKVNVSNIVNKSFTKMLPTKENYTKEILIRRNKELIPYKGIVDLFNEVCVSLPQVTRLTDARKSKITTRFSEHKSIDAFKDIFLKVERSDFLSGRINRNSHENWRCTFDWLFENESNMVKVLEGQYDNKVKDTGPGVPEV